MEEYFQMLTEVYSTFMESIIIINKARPRETTTG